MAMEIIIKKVENGYIVEHDGKKYICQNYLGSIFTVIKKIVAKQSQDKEPIKFKLGQKK